ncbi:MAG: hypothetical protein H6839_13370 [Planctomycetes bacterium]|nr:hypothetical protein [Planctomycetota bacterium]
MGCLYLLLALISPRLLLVVMWIFTTYVQPNAFRFWLWPLLGLIFMPWMTLGLVWAYNTQFGILQIAAIVIGAIMDVSSNGGAERQRRRRQRSDS